MKNGIQSKGDNITLSASPYAVDAGEYVLVGQLGGVAFSDAGNGAEVDISTRGVYDLAKQSADVFTVGQAVAFDTTTKTVRSLGETDSNSSGEAEAIIGVAVAAAGAGASTVRVKLAASPLMLV